jgi:2-polyprenyl-6-methoxyphenol hydroxylase-like FAD-dependent oxidoreductase
MEQVDVAIVGGGIGGTSLGGYLAASGLRVSIVERLTSFSDRVRGEWMAPWGAAELKRLGLYDRFIAAGGHHLSRLITYDELIPPARAEQAALPIDQLHPDVPGPLCLEHVTMQNESLAWAIESGAEVRRGVSNVAVTAGNAPSVSFQHDGQEISIGARLVVGADGRTSTVRRQLGITLEEAPLDHLIAGLLIDGADDWPEDLSAIGKVGDIQYLIFPQGGGKVRLYADYAFEGQARFNGEDGANELLAAFNMDCVPNSQAIAQATPIGPCRSFPSQDAWVDEPSVPGAVLIGDAAGYNDPILGQGLSVTLRDARTIGEALVAADHWDAGVFAPYVAERRERLRRLRFVASFVTTLSARFGPDDVVRRKQAFARIANAPELNMVLAAAYIGPENLPAELFTADSYEKVFGTTQYAIY